MASSASLGETSSASREGITVLAEGTGQISADVVFVHGLNGDAIQTWTKENICWPRDLLPDDLKSARIMTWGYDSKIASISSFSSQASIFGHCENLLFDLDIARQSLATPRPIVFVGHSLGGLVIKQALIRSSEYSKNQQNDRLGSIIEFTAGVVFIATPHNGSDATPLARLVAHAAEVAWRKPNKKLVNDLAKDSDVLEAQRSSFASVSRHMPIRCVYEELPIMGLLIVPEYSAVVAGFDTGKVGIRANHHDVCKFASRDAGYKRASTFIIDLVSEAQRILKRFIKELTQTLTFEEIMARHDDISEAHHKTYEWIFERQEIGFTEWLSRGEGIFWIHGKPGSGKSTLMKFLLKKRLQLLQSFQSTQKLRAVVAGIFFWSAGTPMQKSLPGLLRSLLFQILDQTPSLVQVVFNDEFQQHWRDPSDLSDEWPLDRLFKVFMALTTQQEIPLGILILIDGLDEFQGDHAEMLKLLDLLVQVSKPEDTQKVRFSVCIASRDWNIFRDTLHHYPQLRMQDLTFSDIQLYVTDTLSANPRMVELKESSSSEVGFFEKEIMDKASGVFLWVRLAVASLLKGLTDRDNISELRARLEELPPELEDLYLTMLSRVDERHKDQARFIFSLVLLSPTPLTPYDIALAEEGPDVAITASVEKFSRNDYFVKSREMEGRVRSRTAGLLEIQLLVTLIHKSVKDFFDTQPGATFLRPTLQSRESDPAIALFSSYLRKLKLPKSENKAIDSLDVEHHVAILQKAGDSTGPLQIQLLDELDSVLYDFADTRNHVTPGRECYWLGSLSSWHAKKISSEEVQIYTQTPFTKRDHSIPLARDTIDAFGICQNLHVYIQERIVSQGLDVNGKPGKSLLRYATEINHYGYENGTWKGPNVQMVALLLKHGAKINLTWRGLSIWSLAFHDLCEYFGFRRRLLSLNHLFLLISHLDACLEMLKFASPQDINLVECWPSQSYVQKKGTPLTVLYDCLARLDAEQQRNPWTAPRQFKKSRERFTLMIDGLVERGALRFEDLPETNGKSEDIPDDGPSEEKPAEDASTQHPRPFKEDRTASVGADSQGEMDTHSNSDSPRRRRKRRRKRPRPQDSPPREWSKLSTVLHNITQNLKS